MIAVCSKGINCVERGKRVEQHLVGFLEEQKNEFCTLFLLVLAEERRSFLSVNETNEVPKHTQGEGVSTKHGRDESSCSLRKE